MGDYSACAYCEFSVPKGARVCGHCRNELEWRGGISYTPEQAAKKDYFDARTMEFFPWLYHLVGSCVVAIVLAVMWMRGEYDGDGAGGFVAVGLVVLFAPSIFTYPYAWLAARADYSPVCRFLAGIFPVISFGFGGLFVVAAVVGLFLPDKTAETQAKAASSYQEKAAPDVRNDEVAGEAGVAAPPGAESAPASVSLDEPLPEYSGALNDGSASEFFDFLLKNEGKVVRLAVRAEPEEAGSLRVEADGDPRTISTPGYALDVPAEAMFQTRGGYALDGSFSITRQARADGVVSLRLSPALPGDAAL